MQTSLAYTKPCRNGICPPMCYLSGLPSGDALSDYQIVFFPHAHVLTAPDVLGLQKYVEGGGTLVFGCWSGYRNRNHWCYDAAGKAFYESLTGGQVTDFTVVREFSRTGLGSHQKRRWYFTVISQIGGLATPYGSLLYSAIRICGS